MVNFIFYVFFSTLETSAVFILAFKLFKIDIYFKEIIFAGLIMAFFSYEVRIDHGFPLIDAFLQYILLVCFFWLLFRIHIFYAVIMTGTAYQAYMLIQSLLYFFINSLGLYQLNFPIVSTGIYFLQLLSAVTAIRIGYYVGKKRKGFDFIPDKPDGKIIIGIRDKILFALAFPSIFGFLITLYYVQYFNKYLFILPIFYATLSFGYLYFSTKKDRGDV